MLQFIDLWSPAAENLVLGTAGVESDFGRYVKQVGKGPALGIFEMETVTHDDIWRNFLVGKNEPLAKKLLDLCTPAAITAGAREMVGNLYYATGMCRTFYRRLPDALPSDVDARGMAELWKRRYNTYLGDGTIERALPYFRKACGYSS